MNNGEMNKSNNNYAMRKYGILRGASNFSYSVSIYYLLSFLFHLSFLFPDS